MSILTTTEVASFLGIDASTPGLQDAIDQAEALVAAKMGLKTLEYTTYTDEQRLLNYTTQQVITEHGPIRELTAFEYDGDDETSEVYATDWSIRWSDPYTIIDFDRIRSFNRMKLVRYTYSAGWTDDEGDYPLPAQVAAYVKVMAGLTLNNFLGSGVYDTKLGDMTIKIQRETLEDNLKSYEYAINLHGRPRWGM